MCAVFFYSRVTTVLHLLDPGVGFSRGAEGCYLSNERTL